MQKSRQGWAANPAERKLAGVILLLIVLAGLQEWGMAWCEKAFYSPAYDGAWVQSISSMGVFLVLDSMIHEGWVLGIPMMIGMGAATGQLRLRSVCLLFAAYVLGVWQLIVPIGQGLLSAFLSGGFWKGFSSYAAWMLHNVQLEYQSLILYAEAAVTLVIAVAAGLWLSRRGGPADVRKGRIVLIALCVLLVLVTVLSLLRVVTDPIMERVAAGADGAPVTHEAVERENNWRYLLYGGSIAWQFRPGYGRGPILLFDWLLFAACCLFCARRISLRQLLGLTGIMIACIVLTQALTPVPAETRQLYYDGLQHFRLYGSGGSDFWLHHVPYPLTYLAQLLVCAAGLVAPAALFRALTRKTQA